ncbi:hypothetical protein HOY82DRAFT_605476 [Tuber indicum]|nr:hypothetical protein HOY82DRAFT_605476 [Tuber indicum]
MSEGSGDENGDEYLGGALKSKMRNTNPVSHIRSQIQWYFTNELRRALGRRRRRLLNVVNDSSFDGELGKDGLQEAILEEEKNGGKSDVSGVESDMIG